MPKSSTQVILSELSSSSSNGDFFSCDEILDFKLPSVLYREPNIMCRDDLGKFKPFYDLLFHIDSLTLSEINYENEAELLQWRVNAYDTASRAVMDWQRLGDNLLGDAMNDVKSSLTNSLKINLPLINLLDINGEELSDTDDYCSFDEVAPSLKLPLA